MSAALDASVHDRLMQVSDKSLLYLRGFSLTPAGVRFSARLSGWLGIATEAEAARREGKAAKHTPLDFTGWTGAELAGAITQSIIWCRSCVDGYAEQFLDRVHDITLAAVAERLLDSDKLVTERN